MGRRYGSSLIRVGDRLVEDFRLVNTSVFPMPWLELRDNSDLPGYSVSTALGVGPQSEVRWQAGGLCLQRGQFRLGPWEATTGDPFGLYQVTARSNAHVDLLVYPPVGRAPEVAPDKGRSAGERSHMVRSVEQTVTAAGVRHYTAGDPPRHIHWPTTLRVGDLMVKDFDLEPAGDLWVVLDMEARTQAGQDHESTEEYAVLAATAIVARGLGREQAVGLLAYGGGRVFLPPAKGEEQYWKLMRGLATIRAKGAWPLSQVLHAERWGLGGGAGVVVVASSECESLPAGVELLRRLGSRPSVLLLDAVSFGGKRGAQELSAVLGRMAVRHWVLDREYEFVALSSREKRRRAALRRSERWGLAAPAAWGSPSKGHPDREAGHA
ncbi:MAG: DUF58 domain-containing protein [Anaerolineae bacterium]|nr:DUF58 domain-containing protein [Anaerolineae bacterium]